MDNKYSSVLSLTELKLQVSLGVTEEEREKPQNIKVCFKLFFSEVPKACFSDEIKDTFCYYEIANAVEDYCKNKEFNLLEYLCYQLHGIVRQVVDKNIKIWIRVIKCDPPIAKVEGVTSFEYNDC